MWVGIGMLSATCAGLGEPCFAGLVVDWTGGWWVVLGGHGGGGEHVQ